MCVCEKEKGREDEGKERARGKKENEQTLFSKDEELGTQTYLDFQLFLYFISNHSTLVQY